MAVVHYKMLIARAGLLVRSFWNLTHKDLGFKPAGVLMARVGAAGESDLRVLINSATHQALRVVGDFRVDSAREPFEPVILTLLLQSPTAGPPNIVLHVSGTRAGLAQQLDAAVRDVAPNLRVDPLKTLNGLVSTSVRREHLLAWLSAGFAVLALASAGGRRLYGIVSYSAQLRAQEISIRLTVGGTSRQITLQVLSEAVLLLSTGVLLGTLATLALSRALQTMLFGLQPNDPGTLVFVGTLLMAVGLAAACIPASRATRLDPMVVLRRQ